ncbi:MAG: RHS repeat-associated core domain-containing protein [Lachnospiraceae bacterium]|nr:RHS repeat-associated core domain-containing protein [Lachnospiraceae bacterium]
MTIETTDFEYNNHLTVISGQDKIVNQIEDLNDGILMMMYESENLKIYDKFLNSENEMIDNENIYSKTFAFINCSNVQVTNIIAAENDITVNCSKLTSGKNTVIYSKNGNININVGTMEFNGMIYAPNGIVTINAETANIEGIIICKKIITNTSKFQCYEDPLVFSLYTLFQQIKNDTIINADIKIDNDSKFLIEYDCNKKLEKVDVYVRYDNSKEFEYFMELGNDKIIKIDKKFEYLDIALMGETILGETAKSNASSFDVYMGEIQYYSCDTDEDGIFDRDEVWLTNTNPYDCDTDGDGFSDYNECFVMFTNPLIFTEDTDLDYDGLLTSEEIALGTNPRLADSDFDGINDGADEKPVIYNNFNNSTNCKVKTIVGNFDKVNTILTDNLKVCKIVYDPINKIVKLFGNGEVVNRYFYDLSGHKIADIVEYESDTRANIYSYDKNGNIIVLVNNNDVYTIEYDEENYIQTIFINGHNFMQYTKDINSIYWGNGDTIRIDSNDENNNYYKFYNDVFTAEYITDEFGTIIQDYDILNEIQYLYEYNNEYIHNVTTNIGFSSSYEYSDNEMKITYSDGVYAREQIIYDSENKSNVSLISRDILNKRQRDNEINYTITNQNMKELQNTTYIYGDNHEIIKVVYMDETVLDYKYTDNMQLSEIYLNGELITEYTYNSNGQLYKEHDILTGKVYEFYYDLYNNITQSCSYSDLEQRNDSSIVMYEYQSDLWNDVLTNFDGNEIVYDNIGNPVIYYDGSSMKWDGIKLVAVNKDDSVIKYAYNSDGIRTYKNIDGVETYYFIEGEDIVAEKTGETIIWYIYDEKSEIFGFIYNNQPYYYDKNANKDVFRIVDSEGSVVCTYLYDAWGNVTQIQGNNEIAEINPIRYRSYYWDKETNRYYLKSRYYDSNIKRFLNTDNMARINCGDMDTNLFAYCGDDPINLYDPSGRALTAITIFTISQFEKESRDLQDALCRAFDRTTTWSIMASDSSTDFRKWWRSLERYNLAIINSHATPTRLTSSAGFKFDYSDVVNYCDKISLKLLVILGCNAGHFDESRSIARAFSNKITGKVIASDGTVQTNAYLNLCGWYISFSSLKDKTFQNLCPKTSNRSNYGWLVFVGTGRDSYSARIYRLNTMKLTANIIAEFIDNSKVYNSYK